MVTGRQCSRWSDRHGDRAEAAIESRSMTTPADDGVKPQIKLEDTGSAGPHSVVGDSVEWRRGRYLLSTDQNRLDFGFVTAFLAASYWAPEISEPIVRRAIAHSIGFGLYEGDEQIGFARVVTDRATFAWVGDVFIRESYRGRGLSLWLMRCVLAHPELGELRRWMLASTSAGGLYERLGFRPLRAPERFLEIADPDVHRRQRARIEEAD